MACAHGGERNRSYTAAACKSLEIEKTLKDLPVELIIEILSRVPSKSLVRFTSVCKSWYVLITNSKFIHKHLNHSRPNSEDQYVVISRRYWNQKCLIVSDKTIVESAKTYDPFSKLVGSCKGLICMSFPIGGTEHMYLSNPSIDKIKSLGSFPSQFNTHVVCGFGFHEATNDFKVVRITFLGRVPREVDVYSLNMGLWRRIQVTLSRFLASDTETSCNGAIHWLGSNMNEIVDGYDSIVAFDLNEELFREMMLPSDLRGENLQFSLMDMKGSLSLFDFSLNENHEWGGRYYIWVMREYGIKESWTKEICIEPQERVSRPLGFTKSGRKVIYVNNDQRLVSYNLNNKKSEIRGVNGAYKMDNAFMESLVLLEAKNPLFGETL